MCFYAYEMHKHVFSCLLTCLICTILFYGFVGINIVVLVSSPRPIPRTYLKHARNGSGYETIVVLATQIQIFHGTHPERIEDQV